MIESYEATYRSQLLEKLSSTPTTLQLTHESTLAQFVFCIDVRSEPFRRALEAQGHYETFGFAGFFGVPIQINNQLKIES